uniref:Large ribosomal subunit protein uL6c n=1 Tax=Bornetia secundiflora TaxID=2575637 RepID=A0A4D6WLH6_9FLOR|nr:ribosomal protein L6 [Bornetia secundiflora]
MSRIGKKEIHLPKEIHAIINKSHIAIKGPKGELNYQMSELINVDKNNNTIILSKKDNTKKAQAIHGLSRSIINNMVIGVSIGFKKKLVIEGVGYRSQLEGKNLILNVGYSHPVKIEPPKDIKITVDNNTNILITGINKETVGQIAATIRSIRPPEPYKGKGIRYADEIIRRKVGKAGK